jgi:hypothetical protein
MKASSIAARAMAMLLVAAVAAGLCQTTEPQTRPVALVIASRKPDGSPIAGLSFGIQNHIG